MTAIVAPRGRQLVRQAGIVTVVALIVLAGATATRATPTAAIAALAAVLLVLGVSTIGLSKRDATAVLTVMLGLLLLLPEQYVLVGPLRSVGNPALLVGLGAFALWAAGRLLGFIQVRPGHPVRWTIFAFALASTIALAAGFMRQLSEMEMSGATRGAFPIASGLGIALLAVDGIASRRRLDALLQRLVVFGGIAACVGIVEFAFVSFNYKALTKLPGLTTNVDLTTATRSGFERVDGAAAHPIEYAVAISVLVPLAIHYALHSDTRRRRQLFSVVCVALLAVVPMTVSRSGILAVVVGVGVYLVALAPRQRINALVLALIGLAAFRALVPGLLGTLRSLIFIGSQDPSIAHRQDDYVKIPGLLEGHLVIGRGLGTFQPLQYFFLDNQYLGSLLEGGLIGLTAFIAIFVIGMGCARGARRRSTDAATKSLGQALAASLAGLAAAAGTFDELSFRQTGFLIFLLLGCAGSLWSMQRDKQGGTADATSRLAVQRGT